MMKKIVIDLYGADGGVEPILRGTSLALRRFPALSVVLVGEEAQIRAHLTAEEMQRVTVLHTTRALTNADAPTAVLSGESSMALALTALKEREDCAALLSAGSTGALMVGSIFRLGLVGKLKQPALSSAIPLRGGKLVCIVDCGATLDCRPKDLARFAKMGDAFMRCMTGLEAPRVGLLSVGRESGKGTPLVVETHALLSELPICFIGNIEGSDLTGDVADVVVTDGFSGNLLLKNTEAAGRLAADMLPALAQEFGIADVQGLRERLTWLFDFNSRGGATFLGTKKPVIKMHGCANAHTVEACIDQAMRLEEADFSAKLAEVMTE